MALLTATRPTPTGALMVTPPAVASSDTIAASDLGVNGAILVVINGGGSPDTVAILDGGFTPAANAGVSSGGAVANATSRAFYIDPKAVNTSGFVTVTHTFITTVTYQLYPMG